MTWSLIATGKFATTDGSYLYFTSANYIYQLDPADDSVTEIGASADDFDSRDVQGLVVFPYSAADTLFVVAGGSGGLGVYRYSGTPGSWTRVHNTTSTISGSTKYTYLWADGGRMVVSVADSIATTHMTWYSSDGTTWTSSTLPTGNVFDNHSAISKEHSVSQLQGSKNTPLAASMEYSSVGVDMAQFNAGSGNFDGLNLSDSVNYKFLGFDQDYFYFWVQSTGNIYQTASLSSPSFTLVSAGYAPYGDYLNLRPVTGKHNLTLKYGYEVNNDPGSFGVQLKYYNSVSESWDYIPGDYTVESVVSVAGWSETTNGLAQLIYLGGYLYAESRVAGGFDIRKRTAAYTEPGAGGGDSYTMTHSAGGIPGSILEVS